jgi:HEPN domain-containing protein
MSDLDREVLRKVMQWLSYADDDLLFARHGMTIKSGSPYRLIAFHAQQCVEKLLKSFLVYHLTDFPYTHNISVLLELCAELSDWPETIRDAEELSSYAITARYPGEDREVTKEEAERAIEIAERVKKIVRSALSKEGVKLSRNER